MDTAPQPRTNAVILASRMASSARLRQRRFELFPLDRIFTEVQGRIPGDATSPEGLSDLISSIGEVGILQPVLVEELPGGGGLRLVAGERRLRACRIGHVDQPDNPHYARIPAVVCPGPLGADERATWQLIENLAREDLQPGELAQALIFERCGVLAVRLEGEGFVPPVEAMALEDPVARWNALNKYRIESGQSKLGAPWGEVIRRLGIHLKEDKVEQIVRAFSQMDPEMAEEMDRECISLNARVHYLKLARSKEQAAGDLWQAVRSSGRGKLLYSAVMEIAAHPELGANEAIERAELKQQEANTARAEAALRAVSPRREPVLDDPEGAVASSDEPETPLQELERRDKVDAAVMARALDALSKLSTQLRTGKTVGQYDAGSLRLYLKELPGLVDAAEEGDMALATAV
jgi:ParB family chromosome partitioning protein